MNTPPLVKDSELLRMPFDQAEHAAAFRIAGYPLPVVLSSRVQVGRAAHLPRVTIQ
jgi:hypothetical protein